MTNIPEEIKELYLSDSIRKNIRIHFPNGECADIINDNIDGENFSFTESICSRSQLKFGLCEASVVRFTCVGIENIKGYTIEVYHEIDISGLSDEFITKYGITSTDVPYPYYRWPYGRFVVDECPRQSDMRKRKVVAYSKEAEWDAIPNPMERAKTNGQYDLKYDNPYTFNVAAVAYSNSYIGARDYFEDKTACSTSNSNILGSILYSSEKVQSPSGAYSVPKYACNMYVDITHLTLTSNEDADNLYWLSYADAMNIDSFLTAFESIISSSVYGWDGEFVYLTSDELLRALKYGFFNYKKYDYSSGNYLGASKIVFDEHRYIYPFVNYTDTEEDRYNTSYIHDTDEETFMAIPYNVRIEVVEQSVDDSYKITTTTILSQSLGIRDASKSKIYTVNNLPGIYQSVSRRKCSEQSNYGYRVSQADLPLKSIVQAYAEMQGKFGKRDRNGEFEFATLSDNFALFPGEDVFPGDDTYPSAGGDMISRSNYQTIWYDDEYTKPYGTVKVTFTNESGEEITMSHDLVDRSVAGFVEEDYQIYDLSNNYLIQQGVFTESEISDILAVVAEGIKGVQYMPANIKLSGMPWTEAGDALTVLTKDDGIETLILRRTLKGVQALKDNFESR